MNGRRSGAGQIGNARHPEPPGGLTGRAGIVIALIPVAIGLLTFLVFLPVLGNRFVNWDDNRTIVQNVHVHALSAENIRWMFTHFFMGHYQPLALLSLAVDRSIWGPEPFGVHLTSVLLHVLCAVVFYLLSVRLLRVARPAWAERPALPTAAATVASLLFALHPLRVESVAWATERRDGLSALFFLLGVLAYVAAQERRRSGRSAGPLMVCVAAAMVVSLLAKVMAVMLPPVLLILDLYPFRRLGAPREWLGPGVRGVWVEKLPLVVPGAVMLVVAPLAQQTAWAGLESHSWALRACGALFASAFYLWKTLWPFGLSPLYEMPDSVSEISPVLIVCGALVFLAGPAWLAWRRTWGPFLSAWACYVVLLLPVLGVFQWWPQIAADRYTYLLCMGWVLLLGAGFGLVLEKKGFAGTLPGITIGAVIAVVAGLSWQTSRQCTVWSDSIRLWAHALSVKPDTRIALGNLGAALIEEDRPLEAAAYLRRAVQLRPRNANDHANLGLALAKLNANEDAMSCFRRALELDGRNPIATSGIGVLLYKQGRPGEAVGWLEQAVALEPGRAEAHAHYGNALRKLGRLDQAVEQYGEACRLSPREWSFRRVLADTLAEAGRDDEAVRVLREAVQAEPDDLRRLGRLARMLAACPDAARRRPAEAVGLAQAVVDATGGRVPEYLDTLACAYASAGDFTRAVDAARRACELADKSAGQLSQQEYREHLQLFEKGRAVSLPVTGPATQPVESRFGQ